MLGKVSVVISMLVLSHPLFAQTQQDPTRPGRSAQGVVSQKQQAEHYQLSAIFHSQGRRQAVINNTLVSENESVSGARVIAITPDRVRLALGSSQGAETVTVKLESASVIRRTSEEF